MTNVEPTEHPATVAAPPHTARSKKASSKKGATHKKDAARAKKTTAPRAGSKGAKILALIGRTGGATLATIMKATGWQAHSVRGFLSTARKNGLKIESAKNDAGGRVYRVGE